MKSALIVDDHPVVRAAVRLVLEAERFSEIYEASSGREVLQLLREHQPQLVVLDLKLFSLDGLDVIERIKANDFVCPILVFTSCEAVFYQERCLRAGAMAFVQKTNDLQQLHQAIQALMSGYTYFTALPNNSNLLSGLLATEKQLIDLLSNQELKILVQLASGKSNKSIAEEMHLSHKTVSTYKSRLMIKLGVSSAVHLRDFVVRNHLI